GVWCGVRGWGTSRRVAPLPCAGLDADAAGVVGQGVQSKPEHASLYGVGADVGAELLEEQVAGLVDVLALHQVAYLAVKFGRKCERHSPACRSHVYCPALLYRFDDRRRVLNTAQIKVGTDRLGYATLYQIEHCLRHRL